MAGAMSREPSYHPPEETLAAYARVLIDFALGGGGGIEPGDVVRIVTPEAAKPLYVELHRAVLRSGGHPIGHYLPSEDAQFNIQRDYFELASEQQLDFFAARYMKGLVEEIDHQVSIICDTDMHALEGIEPSKIMRSSKAMKPWLQWRTEKENRGDFSWTLALYGTAAMAAEARISQQEYWEQITEACFLDEPDPIARWREVSAQIGAYVQRLSSLPIEKLHVLGQDVDLHLTVGESRKWVGGSGRNIPSFEIFTSPDWRGTEGWIQFNQPLYRYGNLIKRARLEFERGLVVKASAETSEHVLAEMIATEGANKVGEFSLTDRRFSRITRFMAETLYDENVGGPFGNTHIAVGKSYHDCYAGDPADVTAQEWQRLGFNESTVHTDIVSTADRTVTATLTDGSARVIYRDGQFQLD